MLHIIENTITVGELKAILKWHDDADFVCIRQCAGTDFPLFISIEDANIHNDKYENTNFPILTI